MIRRIVPENELGDDRLEHRRRSRLLVHLLPATPRCTRHTCRLRCRRTPRGQLRLHRASEAGDAGGTAPAHSVFRIRQSRRVHVEHGPCRRLSMFRSPGSNLQGNYKLASRPGAAKSANIRVLRTCSSRRISTNPLLSSISTAYERRELGLSQREVVANVITALTSNQMIAPSLWIDPRNGNPYYLAVQYPEKQVQEHDRSSLDSAARTCLHAADPTRHGQQHPARSKVRPRSTTTRSEEPSTFSSGRSAKI